ncbi:nucleotide-binding universal stress UspA family protein [Stella humosa]|uniref:Nucleotide-binding universal stress UspA family protein n=1 Tax=Stella humosa TaxID=94 RepID=A0A3N1LIK4_9PROT|nr:universal stress protein [Stella humosa]ROP90994.1 nucleotide-binding universal stress UspA family protein [Stella humosa]
MPRIFLVVVDESDELKVALRYACRRARRTGGRVALLYVIDTDDDGQWMGVKELMREEKRAEAEALLMKVAAEVEPMAGSLPVVYIREGRRREALLELIDEDPSISILVLAASTSPDGPGPLISYLAGKYSHRLKVPVTIVPGSLTDAQIAALA